MAEIINSLEQLKQFIDDKGMIEIVIRDKKKRYVDFTKLLINNTKDEQGKETLNKVLNKLDKNNVLYLLAAFKPSVIEILDKTTLSKEVNYKIVELNRKALMIQADD